LGKAWLAPHKLHYLIRRLALEKSNEDQKAVFTPNNRQKQRF
jgi:hypothetical protein